MQGDTPMSNQQARLSSGGMPPERAPGAFRSPASTAAGGTLARRTHPGNW